MGGDTWSGRGQGRGGPSAHVCEGTVWLCALSVVFTVGMDKQTLLPVRAVGEGPADGEQKKKKTLRWTSQLTNP